MTYREISYCLDKINARKHSDYRSQAALHGLKIKPIESAVKEKIADPKKSEAASQLMKQAIERRKAEMNG